MSLFDDFIKAYQKGFLLSNFYLSLDNLERNLNAKKLSLEKTGQNFIFYQQIPRLMWYFANENLKAKDGFFVKILGKNEVFLQKQDEFLQQSGFVKFAEFKEMKKAGQSVEFKLLNAEFANPLKDAIYLPKSFTPFCRVFLAPNFCFFMMKGRFAKSLHKMKLLCF